MIMIKNLVFDFGKVLVDYDFMPILDSFFGEDKEKEKEFCALFLSKEFIDECDKEEIPFRDFIQKTQDEHRQFADALQLFYDRYADFVTGEIPGMGLLLSELKSSGFNLYGITNWCSKVYEVIERYPIFKLLDGYVISSEEHLLKPEKAIYECLCNRFSLLPEECLFTDDKIENVEGAKVAGMNAVLFKNAEDYHAHLQSLIGSGK